MIYFQIFGSPLFVRTAMLVSYCSYVAVTVISSSYCFVLYLTRRSTKRIQHTLSTWKISNTQIYLTNCHASQERFYLSIAWLLFFILSSTNEYTTEIWLFAKFFSGFVECFKHSTKRSISVVICITSKFQTRYGLEEKNGI